MPSCTIEWAISSLLWDDTLLTTMGYVCYVFCILHNTFAQYSVNCMDLHDWWFVLQPQGSSELHFPESSSLYVSESVVQKRNSREIWKVVEKHQTPRSVGRHARRQPERPTHTSPPHALIVNPVTPWRPLEAEVVVFLCVGSGPRHRPPARSCPRLWSCLASEIPWRTPVRLLVATQPSDPTVRQASPRLCPFLFLHRDTQDLGSPFWILTRKTCVG